MGKYIECSKCGSLIGSGADTCKFCKTKVPSVQKTNGLSKENKIYAKQHSSYWTFTILGLVLPIIGIIVGIVYLTKKDVLDRKVGEHTIVMSIIGFIISWCLIARISPGGSSTFNTSTTTKPGTLQQTSQGKVEVKSEQQKKVYGYEGIVGEVVNNTNRGVSYVKVTATFYDKDGKVTGTSFTYAGDTAGTPLLVSATAPFEIISMEKDLVIDHYKLDVNWQ